MIKLKEMLGALPDVFHKREDSNIGKLLDIFAQEFGDVKNTLETTEQWRDVDQAEGKVLDRIGKNVQESRGQKIDEKYRQFIKTKIRANLSPGDIETINSIARVFVGERFQGLQEGWQFEPLFDTEPAAIRLDIDADMLGMNPLPFDAVDRVVAGGIRVHWDMAYRTHLSIKSEFQVSDEPTDTYKTNVNLQTEYHSSMNPLRYAGTFKAGEVAGLWR